MALPTTAGTIDRTLMAAVCPRGLRSNRSTRTTPLASVTLTALVAVDPRIVAAVRTQLRARDGGRVGWKAGFGIAGVAELIGDTPVPGHLTTTTQLPPGAAFDPRGAGALHADCEVVVTVGDDELGVALELVDLARQEGSMEDVVAGNVLHLAFALGPSGPGPPGEARLVVNGEVRAQAAARADHGDTVVALGRILEAAGERLQAGDRIITGSVVQIPLAPGDEVVAEIDGIGHVGLTVAGGATLRRRTV
jgi:2-keto-4-pentenoate hydratase